MEEETIMLAMTPDDLQEKGIAYCSTYTHCEVHPAMILGVCASIIPFPDHNQVQSTPTHPNPIVTVTNIKNINMLNMNSWKLTGVVKILIQIIECMDVIDILIGVRVYCSCGILFLKNPFASTKSIRHMGLAF